jgi:hypothetical protein
MILRIIHRLCTWSSTKQTNLIGAGSISKNDKLQKDKALKIAGQRSPHPCPCYHETLALHLDSCTSDGVHKAEQAPDQVVTGSP